MKLSVPDELLPAHRLGHVHFVGIGGAGLSAIARIMLARGIAVSARDTTSCCWANVLENRFKLSIDATMSSRSSLSVPTKLSNREISSRT